MNSMYRSRILLLIVVQIMCTSGWRCWAPKQQWSNSCVAGKYLWGTSRNTGITYLVEVLRNHNTTVCCQGYSALSSAFHLIGCGNTTFQFTLDWGNYIDWPEVLCFGNPDPTYVTWNFLRV